MKAFVRQDCSARLARARLRQSGPINVEFKAGDLIMYRKAEGPRWRGPGRIIGFDLRVLWTLHQGTPVAVATGRARPANVSEILAHMVQGDRLSERTNEQFTAAGQQQGFVDISGRRCVRSESGEGEGESQQPEAEPATPLEDAWMRRNPDGATDPGIRLVGRLTGRPGSAAASSVVDRERSRSRVHEGGDGSGGGETANFATLMARAENIEERNRDDAVDAC